MTVITLKDNEMSQKNKSSKAELNRISCEGVRKNLSIKNKGGPGFLRFFLRLVRNLVADRP